MRSNVALSVVIVVFGAIVTSPRQLVEPITVSESARVPGWLVPLGDGRGSWIPIIYVVVALILYRLLSAPLEVSLERGGRPRHVALAQVAALVAAVAVGSYYLWSSVTYFDSLSFLERAPASLAGPHVVAANAAVLGGAVYLAGTVLALLLAASVATLLGGEGTAGRGEAAPDETGWSETRNQPTGETARNEPARNETARNEAVQSETARSEAVRKETAGNGAARSETGAGRVYRGAGVADLAVCAAVGVVQNREAGMPGPLWSVGLGIAGVGLVLAVNQGRQVPASLPRAAVSARQGPGLRTIDHGGGKSGS